jgi:hypothetical protein
MAADQATDDMATPPANPFSIDNENEDGVLLAAADADELEGNYCHDDDGDDASVDDEEFHASTVKLVSRTNLLMQNFNEYLTDITGEGDSGQSEQLSLKLNNGGGNDANGSSNTTTVPTLYRDFIDIEENNNVDNNPASYEDIERELQMQGRYPKRVYAQPLCHSKRVRRGIGTIIIAAIIIGVSVGVSNSKKNQRLPDWNEELKEQIEKEGITGDGLPGAKPPNWKPGDALPPTGGSHVGGQMGYEDSYNTYHHPNSNTITNTQSIPEFHTGSSSANHHAGSGPGPYNHNVQVSNQPHHDTAHQILDGISHANTSSGSSSQQQQVLNVYLDAQAKYKPIWFDRSTWTGTTYQEAEEFCSSRDPIMDICPYEAYCPDGPSGHPYDGSRKEAFGSWAPVNNDPNTWVQVGPDDQCVLYSYSHGHSPEWGLEKGGNEQQTRHIMCCEVDDTAEDSAVDRNPNLPNSGASDQQQQQQQQQQESAYYNTEQTNVKPNIVAEEYLAAQEWNPTWYSRSDGWLGQTYEQASDFCRSLGDTSDLCDYSVICPTGPNHLPYGGEVTEEGGSWAPIKDSKNGWVSVGDSNVCIRYMTLHLETPSWGITGQGNEEITRHLPCCSSPYLPTYSPTTKFFDVGPTASFEFPTSSNTLHSANGEMNSYELAAMEYEPVWYDRSTGWTGRTWNEAVSFCASMKNNFNEEMVLCPMGAVCPMGPGQMPYQGTKPDFFQTWVPINGAQENEWVQIGSDPDTQCMTHEQALGHQADWGMTGEGSEEITRHIMCCAIDRGPSQHDFTQIEQPTSVVNVADALAKVESKYKPVAYDRQSGWGGSTYADAIIFCANQESRIPCPYEAYCPNGEYADPYGGVSDNPNGAWAPMMDAPNSWVQIGKVATCQNYNDMHSHPPLWGLTEEDDSESFTRNLQCCEEPYEPESSLVKPFLPLTDREEKVLNNLHPVWFSRSHGYRGTTHEEAELFCNAAVGMHLCPIEAYCPNGPTSDRKPLYLQKDAFQGEQWAPVSPSTGIQTDLGNEYVMIGTLDGNSSSTCMSYDSLHTNPLPPWSADGSKTELKQHVMCCEKAGDTEQQHAIEIQMSPIWLDKKHGWGGGSHEDAEKFCNELGGKKLCPYVAYCPHGVGRQPLGGHSADFNSQGVQYSPLYGESNAWVMIGQKDGNAATTCMMHTQLEGGEPDWGLNDERQDIKNHILCCSI